MTFYGRIRTIDRILIRPKRFGSDRIRNTACTPNYSSWTKLTPPPFISPVFVRPLAALKNLFFKVFNTAQVFSYLDQRELCGPSAVSSRFPIQYIYQCCGSKYIESGSRVMLSYLKKKKNNNNIREQQITK